MGDPVIGIGLLVPNNVNLPDGAWHHSETSWDFTSLPRPLSLGNSSILKRYWQNWARIEGSIIVEKLSEKTWEWRLYNTLSEKGETTTGFFVGSFSEIAKENRDKFWKYVFLLLQLLSPWERNFIKMFNASDSVNRGHSTDRWFSYM